MNLDQILHTAVRGGASDIILKTGTVPLFRFKNNLVPLTEGQSIQAETMRNWVDQILPKHLAKRLQSSGDADFSFQSGKGYRFRVNLFRQRQNFGLVLRVISSHVRTLEELQLPLVAADLTHEMRGLILVTGATGSGKSTTLAAMIDRINSTRAAHIITIEDPIEFIFQDKCSTISQREIGIDTDSFSNALRAALRQNPDVIFVGELRDQETTETALMAAETGHLVLSTLHTIDAVDSITRLMSYFSPYQHSAIRMMLSHTLKAVISQRLVTTIGEPGQVAATEVMISNANVRDVLLNSDHFGQLHDCIKKGDPASGTQSFDQSLLSLQQSGVITREEALAQASSREDLELQINGVGA